MAVNNVQISNLGTPKTLTEFERNWATLSPAQDKLLAWLQSFNWEAFAKTCKRGSLESDFLMKIFAVLPEMPQISAESLLQAISQNPNLSLTIKFLTNQEKLQISEALNKTQLDPSLSQMFR